MNELLLKLLGGSAEQAGRIVRVAPDYHGDFSPGVVILVALALVALAFWFYYRADETLSPFRRYFLASLRAAFFILLAVLLLRPILVLTVAGSVRQSLLILVDTSSSMTIEDVRDQPDDLKRAAIATNVLDPRDGLKQSLKGAPPGTRTPARIELVKAVLRNPRLNLLTRLDKDFDISVYRFDRDVGEVLMERPTTAPADDAAPQPAASQPAPAVVRDRTWVDRLAATGPVTALGDAVRDTILRKRGQPVAGLLVISDFASNSGSVPLEAAQMARNENVPLYTYGVGITSPKDIIVGTVFSPEVAFVRDEVPVSVRVRSQGLGGQQAKLLLMLSGKIVDTKDIDLQDDGEQAVSLKFTPAQKGDFTLKAFIEPRPDEIVKDNNESAPKHLKVIDGRIKVLHVEQTPRWEFKYLQTLLLRDRRVDYKCILYEGDPAITETPGTPYLKQFPPLKELAEQYDVVILGDVDPKKLTPQDLSNLSEFVSRLGGSMIMVAGRQFSPLAYRKTPVDKMLPVEIDTGLMEGANAAPADRPVHLELTALGKESLMLKLAEKDAESLAKWAALPPIYWEARVARPKPAAEVLVVDSDPGKASRFGKLPVIALQQYGLGQVLFVGTDNTWRWRKNAGDQLYVTLWSQIVERMSLPHMLGASKRTQLNTDREKYATGDRVTIYARLYRERDLEPITDPTVKGIYSLEGEGPTTGPATDHEITLRPLPDQPGMYRAEFVAPAPGTYAFHVDGDPKTELDFVVTEPRAEIGETALNVALMKEMADKSGGLAFREEDLYHLPDQIKSTAQPVLSRVEVEVWCSPLYYIILVLLLGTEWIVRKASHLK